MKVETKIALLNWEFLAIPFIIGAAFHFCDLWLSIPIAFVLVIRVVTIFHQYADLKDKEK